MNTDQIIQRLKNQGTDASKNMMDATRIRPLDLRDFESNPTASPLSEEDMGKLVSWFRGEYGMSGTSGGWVHMPMGKPAVIPLGVHAETPDYDALAVDYHPNGDLSRRGVVHVRDAVPPPAEGKSLAERKEAKTKREQEAAEAAKPKGLMSTVAGALSSGRTLTLQEASATVGRRG